MLIWTPQQSWLLNLDGQTISANDPPGDQYARLKIDNDGKVYRSIDTGSASWVQIDAATGDWVTPNSAAPGAFQVRYTGLTGTALVSAPAAEDTWYAISGGDAIFVQRRLELSGAGTTTSTFTVELRAGSSGSAIASGSYTLSATIPP